MDAVLAAPYRAAIADSVPSLTAWVWGGGDENLHCGLFANDISPAPGMDTATFDAPAYTGYAPIDCGDVGALVYTDPSTGDWVMRASAGVTFQPGDDEDLPVTVYGYWISVGTGGGQKTMWAARFDEPFTFQSSSDALEVEPLIRLHLGGIS